MDWIADPTVLVGLVTLVALEIVLGVDNLIFLAILSDKLPPAQRQRARVIGLSLALLMRLGLLASISWVMSLTAPLFSLWRYELSWRDLILIAGGLFLLVKATSEIHDRLEVQQEQRHGATAGAAFWPIVAQIVLLDAVFSLDSVITAVGMVNELYVMMTAVVIAVIAMLVAAKPLTEFITKRPSLVILCLGFLLMIGLVLMADGFGAHVPKGYVYAAIGFSVLIEILNQLAARGQRKWGESLPPRRRLIHAVLRTLAGMPVQAPAVATAKSVLAPQEERMVRGVLELAERPVTAIMTPRREVAWLEIHEKEVRAKLVGSTHRAFPVARGSPDQVGGVVRKEDVLARCLEGGNQGGNPDLEPLAREPHAVPETASVLQALNFFKTTPVELALVVDEYGAMRGVVTRTDVLEAIAGNLPDPEERAYVEKRADGSLVIDGAARAYELVECFGELPPGEYDTAAGMVLALLGRLPLAGERVGWEDWELEVAEVSDRRVARVVARKNRGQTPTS